MKAHLLHAEEDFRPEEELPAHYDDLSRDLNVDVLLHAMAGGDRFLLDVARRVLAGTVATPEGILYRQAVLRDCLAKPEVVREMYQIATGALEDQRSIWGFHFAQTPSSILVGARQQLEPYFGRLRQLRIFVDHNAGTFQSDGLRRLVEGLRHDLDDDYLDSVGAHLKQLRFRDGEVISARLGWDNSGVDYVLRARTTTRSGLLARLGIGERSSYSFNLPPRDEAGSQALGDLVNRGTNLVANAVAQSVDHISSYFTLLKAELAFYVACLNLSEELAAIGVPTCFPVPLAPRPPALSTAGLTDICLSLQSGVAAVGNDLEVPGKPLVMVTGANSGGKSTFLRSIGLAQVMMQCGMFVTARNFEASVGGGTFSHFIREEDASMVSGRLDEELARMSTLSERLRPCSLVLFNESFAATNEREGSEIARQVIHALTEADMRVVFVTHQYDLAESFRLEHADTTVFMRAERGPEGERSFKLVPAPPLPTSFGEDVYMKVGRWLGEPAREASEPPADPGAGDA